VADKDGQDARKHLPVVIPLLAQRRHRDFIPTFWFHIGLVVSKTVWPSVAPKIEHGGPKK